MKEVEKLGVMIYGKKWEAIIIYEKFEKTKMELKAILTKHSRIKD